jgi:hypothetical protein
VVQGEVFKALFTFSNARVLRGKNAWKQGKERETFKSDSSSLISLET